MSDESDIGSSRDRRKRKTRYIEDSSDSDSSMDITRRKRRKHRLCIRESESESDSSIEIVHKKRVGRVTSDDGASTSGSEIVRLKKTVTTLVSDSEAGHSTDSGSDSDWCTESETKKNSNTAEAKEASKHDSSESGDDQLEKCPICLLPFKSQEVGLPESCDHSFCIDCILEWSKSVNTCPVDRQVFNLILVKSHYNGKVTKQIPIQPAEQQVGINEIQDDPTFCEICGRCDREDRMLLCDGCDLGFHMECLNPPLNEIPAGLWFCPDCEPEGQETLMDIYEVHLLLENAESMAWHSRSRTRNPTRLVPRTRQSERVRTRVITHRSQRQRNTNEHRQGQRNVQSGPSSLTDRNRSTSGMRSRRRKRSKKPRIKITYEIDPATGERIAIRTKIKRKNRRSRKQRERARMAAQAAKSVKGRLAAQLGICIPRSNGQRVIETRPVDNTNSIGYQRSQAGIPALHLFGTRDDLDYFGDTDSEEEISSNANILIRRRPHNSDVSIFRRAARRKAIVAPVVQPQASTSVLDSILDIQSKFHSRNSVLSVNEDGSVKIDSKTGDLIDRSDRNNNTNKNRGKERGSRRNDNRRINLDDYTSAYFRQTPMYGNGPSNPPPTYSNVNNADFTRRDTAVDSGNTTVTTSSEQVLHGSTPGGSNEDGPNYSLQQVCSSFDYDPDKKEKDKDKSGNSSPGMHNSDSELDIYSDIETVSTSRAEEYDAKPPSPTAVLTPNTPTDDDANNSDVDLVIDTEKADDSKEQVSSTVDLADRDLIPHSMLIPHLNIEGQNASLEIQNQTVQSSNSKLGDEKEDKDEEDDDDSEDGCPNFSIYSSESMNIAKTTEMQLRSGNVPDAVNTQASSMNSLSVIDEVDRNIGAITSAVIAGNSAHASIENRPTHPNHLDNTQLFSYSTSAKMQVGLYSDSEDESVVKITKIPDPKNDTAEEPEHTNLVDAEFADDATTNDTTKDKKSALADISNMTEDISEEERSYTPCLDERTHKQGLEGLDTEMISDDDRNDFDESHELKAASEGDALEINAKESELDFTKPEDYEEGEIIDKLKNKKPPAEQKNQPQEKEKEPEKEKPPVETKEPEPTPASFKKLSKSNKERHYRDKDKENVRSKSREKKSDREIKKSRRREKRKDLERYNVRSIIAEKPRRVRDKFGRDESRKKSPSRSSKSLSPQAHRSLSRERGRSHSRERVKKKKRVRSLSRSRTPPARRRSRSPRLRRQKSRDRSGEQYPPRERANSRERAASRERRKYRNRSRGPSISPRRRREWLQSSRCWSRSQSRSFTPEKRMTPSWTPPRLLESQSVKPQNLTVILNNDHNQKKKDKAKRINKKGPEKGKKRRRNRTPPPSKEVFASGNNILVSVSFNKDKNQRDVTNKRKRDVLDESVAKKQRKAKDKRGKPDAKRKKKRKDLSGVKPVAIIDLDRSPFREVTPAPEDVIVLTDSENAESNDMLGLQKAICDSSQQVASPERPMTANYLTGPKTPPEPQVKFTLNPKQTQLRAISNPLHEPDDIEEEIDPQEELEQRLNESMHKGPNTPPEPPNSPPSSPDAYDPFEPTKSRSPTPEPLPPVVQLSSTSQNDSVREESLIDSRNEDDDETIDQSHTPPAITDIQPADSQCSNMKPMSPEKSPEQHNIGVVINRVVQSQAAIFPTVTSKSISSSFSNGSMVTSSPMVPPRINILSSTVLTPTTIASALPQRIVLPNTTKSSPVKVSPNKLPIKSTPIKPMPAKSLITKSNKSTRKSNNHTGNENYDALLDFDSPYSPGSSDYEDLFEPPTEAAATKQPTSKPSQSAQKSKDQNAFDILFGASPVNNFFSKATTKSKGKTGNNNNNIGKYKKSGKVHAGTKQVGVKIDEDTLKILDELPNSAVEMQVKYKYLKKLNRQERVVEEVKLVLKPHYNKKHINKEEYKDILRRAVPKICHNKSGEINPQKIQNLIEAYVRKIRHSKKVTSSSSVNPQKA